LSGATSATPEVAAAVSYPDVFWGMAPAEGQRDEMVKGNMSARNGFAAYMAESAIPFVNLVCADGYDGSRDHSRSATVLVLSSLNSVVFTPLARAFLFGCGVIGVVGAIPVCLSLWMRDFALAVVRGSLLFVSSILASITGTGFFKMSLTPALHPFTRISSGFVRVFVGHNTAFPTPLGWYPNGAGTSGCVNYIWNPAGGGTQPPPPAQCLSALIP